MLPDQEIMEGTGLVFRRAKSMPKIPHQYVVRTPENEKEFSQLFHDVIKKGTWELWHGKKFQYWHRGDGWKYWNMWTTLEESKLINRAKVNSEPPVPVEAPRKRKKSNGPSRKNT
jgi:hypothetical protein